MAGFTPLCRPAMNGDLETVKYLLIEGADVNVVNDYGFAPLSSAVYNGHLEVAKVLLKYGAKVNQALTEPAVDGFTPLGTAAYKGDMKMVQVLLQYHADVNKPNNHGFTPLQRAAHEGHLEVVQILLMHGANVNTFNKFGFTPLHSAVCQQHLDVVEVLLKHGADVCTVNKYGYTPLVSAQNLGYEGESDIVDVLLNYMSNELRKAAYYGNLNAVQLLWKWGAPIEVTANKGRQTPLMLAEVKGHKHVEDYLRSLISPKSFRELLHSDRM